MYNIGTYINRIKELNAKQKTSLFGKPLASIYSFTRNNRKLFKATSSVAPISEAMAIQSVNQPGTTNNNAISLIPIAKMIFALIIVRALRLSFIVNGSF